MNAEVRHMRTQAELALLNAFATHKDKFSSVKGERADAFRMFEEAGLPHRRVEEWKYTDLRALMREAKPLALPPDANAHSKVKSAAKLLKSVDAQRLMIVNGTYVPEWSDSSRSDPGVTIVELLAWLGDDQQFRLNSTVPVRDVALLLNTAFMSSGVVIKVAKGAQAAKPIHLAHVFTGDTDAAMFPRSLVFVEPGARLTLIESYEGPAGLDYQVNAALELVVGEGARVDRIKIGIEGSGALHIETVLASVGAKAQLHDFAFTTGSAVTRNQTFVALNGEGITATIKGANLLKDRQHVDSTLVVDHAAVGGVSRELFKHVLDGESRGVFQGKIIVRPGAQKTDGKMATHALLLSDGAEADSKPELEIFADDVQCGHGATAGALDEDLLFYLRARGIPAKEAEALLIQSFVGEAIEGIEYEGVRDALTRATEQWLKARG